MTHTIQCYLGIIAFCQDSYLLLLLDPFTSIKHLASTVIISILSRQTCFIAIALLLQITTQEFWRTVCLAQFRQLFSVESINATDLGISKSSP